MFCPPGYQTVQNLVGLADLAAKDRIAERTAYIASFSPGHPDLAAAAIRIRTRAYSLWLQRSMMISPRIPLYMCSPAGVVLAAPQPVGWSRSPWFGEISTYRSGPRLQIFFPIGLTEQTVGFQNSVDDCLSVLSILEYDPFEFIDTKFWTIRKYAKPFLWLISVYADAFGSIAEWLLARRRARRMYSWRRAGRKLLDPFVGWSLCYRDVDAPADALAFEALFVQLRPSEQSTAAEFEATPEQEHPMYDLFSGPVDFSEASVARWIVRGVDLGKFTKMRDARDALTQNVGARSFLRAWARAREARPEIGKGGRRPPKR